MGDPDLTDPEIRSDIITDLKETGDVERCVFREHGTDDVNADVGDVDRPVPTLHIYLSTDNITSDVMQVLSEYDLSMTPLNSKEILADAATSGSIWKLSPEIWAKLVSATEFYRNIGHKEAYKLSKSMAEDEDFEDIETVEDGLDKLEQEQEVLEILTSGLTDEQYEAFLELSKDVSLDDLEADGIENHVQVESTKPGLYGLGFFTDSDDSPVPETLPGA